MALYPAVDPYTGLPKKKQPAPGAFDPNSQEDTSRPQGGYRDGGGVLPATGGGLPGSISTPGFTPDYKSLIANDPIFAQLKADLAAQGAGDLAGRNSALNRLLVGFGSVPDMNSAAHSLGINDLGSAIDPTTAQLAGENQFSTTARLNQAHTDALRQIKHGLAARHALQSGELGYQLGNENRAYGGAQNDATQALLDAISGLQGNYTSAQKAAMAQSNQGLSDATNRQIGLNPATGSSTATYDPATGLYKGPNGEWYNPDGTPHVGTPTPTAPAAPTAAQTTGIDPNANPWTAPTNPNGTLGGVGLNHDWFTR